MKQIGDKGISRTAWFCAGVERAIKIVDEALSDFGTPVYVRHDMVHNRIRCRVL